MTTAYAMLVNGGKRITPTFIDRIQDRLGRPVFKHDDRPCENCRVDQWDGQRVPRIPDTRQQVTDPVSAFQIVQYVEGCC